MNHVFGHTPWLAAYWPRAWHRPWCRCPLAVIHANGGTTLDIAGELDLASTAELGATRRGSRRRKHR